MGVSDGLDDAGIHALPAEPLITGFVALVIQPDAATIRTAYGLAASLLPAGSEQALVPGSLPHVTLTQCAVRDLPRERVVAFLDRLDHDLRARTIPLGAVIPFGGGFVFWCVDERSVERSMLQRAHEDAIELAGDFLDPVANGAVVEGTAQATRNDAVLVENARAYGYAFVRDRYLPHITLGFDSRLASGAAADSSDAFHRGDHRHVMTVERVVLARLGRLGRVDAILSL